MDESMEYTVYDVLIEDRKGTTFSVWYALLKGRLWFIEYSIKGYGIKRIDFHGGTL